MSKPKEKIIQSKRKKKIEQTSTLNHASSHILPTTTAKNYYSIYLHRFPLPKGECNHVSIKKRKKKNYNQILISC